MTKRGKQLEAKLKEVFVKFKSKKTTPKEFHDGVPGLYEDIPFQDYARLPAVNFSSLKSLDHSPAAYRYAMTEEVPSEEPDFLRLGNFIHTIILEDDQAMARYVVMPDLSTPAHIGLNPKTGKPYDSPRATKAYKQLVEQFRRQNADKIILTQEELDIAAGIRPQVLKHKQLKQFAKNCFTELTIVWNDPCGLLCKARLDLVNFDAQVCFDLKTTVDLLRFNIGDYNYHQQACFYCRGILLLTDIRLTPYIGVVEKKPPFSFQLAPISPSALDVAVVELDAKLTLLHRCVRDKSYPHPPDPKGWFLPPWYKRYSLPKGASHE